MPPLKQLYLEKTKAEIKQELNFTNDHQVPVLKKVVISMGTAKQKDKHVFEACAKDLMMISGQKPVITRAKKSISNFKLREGQEVGLKVTLRRNRMYEFLYKFFHIVCPTLPDFRGLKVKFDGRGSYSVGLDTQQVFPEINLDQSKHVQGMNITVVTSAKTDEECFALLSSLGCPFRQKKT
ncbi:MAG: 50S ribosomal protein L5 [Chlamydiae bacterium]|nr:50S ribosomal protein L5 [Chlamydiota bacterium]